MMFSIVCLTYKRSKLLEESVYSVIQQTYTNWELLIINDYISQTIRYFHPQIKIFNLKEKFKTIGEKRNFGLKNAIGDLVLQLDDDDFLLPDYLGNLKKLIRDHDCLIAQRPILYYENTDKVYLSPVPQYNTFLYKRVPIIENNINYDALNYDELTPFYHRVIKYPKLSKLYGKLKTEECGYVYRQDLNNNRKYMMSKFKTETLDEQNKILTELESESGDIVLEPKWNKDYISIIKKNLKVIPPAKNLYPEKFQETMKQAMEDAKKEAEAWKSVKPTWGNALKLIDAIKSRGVVSTVLDVVGVDKTFGERVSEEVFQQRKLSCFGDKDKRINACNRLKYVENRGYFCGGCGCGQNNLARLDADTPDEYTKLHYPELQCPLKRNGFSNEESYSSIDNPNQIPMSIIIPVLNDNEELNLTIKSIYDTSPPNVEIIAIDDASDIPVKIEDSRVKLFRFEQRMGAGQARHYGALNASSKHLLFIDSHMRFDKNWFANAMSHIVSTPKTLWCGVCLGLTTSNMNIDKPSGVYTGARLVLYAEKNKTIFDGVWIPEIKSKDDYEISCVMGACYFIHKEWYFYIKGLEQTTMWGSEEPILSVKTWLAGGEVKLMKSVRIGHKFRDTAPYSTNVSHIYYNKLAYMYMLFPDEMYEKLKNKFIKNGNLEVAVGLVEQNKSKLDEEKEYYKSIFKHDIYWLCEKFKIEIPT